MLAAAAVVVLLLAVAFDDSGGTDVDAGNTTLPVTTVAPGGDGGTSPITTVPGGATVVPTTSVAPGDVKVVVVNAARVSGAAGSASTTLKGAGFTTLTPTNIASGQAARDSTTVLYRDGYADAAALVAQTLTRGSTVPTVQALTGADPVDNVSEANIVVMLGRDLASRS